MASPKRFNRLPAFVSRPSGDLAGRTVALSADVPAVFDAPIAPHHKLIGRWVAAREPEATRYTRHSARERIEQVFAAAVRDILAPIDLVDLSVAALVGESSLPPALAIVCPTIGQIDLGWIENTNVLRNTLPGFVAPVGWRAAAYQALGETLPAALPVFGFDDLMEELALYYWDGSTDDAGARAALIDYHGEEALEAYQYSLPSAVRARRPDWMTAKAAPLKDMPADLRRALRHLRETHTALKATDRDASAWVADFEQVMSYVPGMEDCGTLAPLTIVPVDHFAREVDDVGRFGMENGFFDIAGLSAPADPASIDAWFASLKLGADYLLAVQQLIALYPDHQVKAR